MERENEIKAIVAENIVKYRKANNMTQLQFAEKLDYTDKAISKWERGESIPDLFILMKIVDMFGITLNDLVTKHEEVKPKQSKHKISKFIISLLSIGVAWLVATILFTALMITEKNTPGWSYPNWMVFIYALAVSSIIATVFSCIWGRHLYQLLCISSIYYTLILAIFLQLITLGIPAKQCWYIFLLIIPMQLLTIFWYWLKHTKGPKKNEKQNEENL